MIRFIALFLKTFFGSWMTKKSLFFHYKCIQLNYCFSTKATCGIMREKKNLQNSILFLKFKRPDYSTDLPEQCKFCLIKYELNFHEFFIKCVFSFVVSLQKWILYFLRTINNGDIRRNNHFSSEKSDVIFSILIRLKFQGFHCKSGIAIFE